MADASQVNRAMIRRKSCLKRAQPHRRVLSKVGEVQEHAQEGEEQQREDVDPPREPQIERPVSDPDAPQDVVAQMRLDESSDSGRDQDVKDDELSPKPDTQKTGWVWSIDGRAL
tara:strand:+ start:53870 stop:54211 length:342 start_codon:yes stop_codon:yes gene_type:complete